MSAYICSDRHIATIVVAYGRLIGDDFNNQAFANTLLAENIRSVNYRYKENTPIEPCDLSDHEADARTPPELVAMCECLDYQSCEHPEWETSNAHQLLELITAQFRAAGVARGFGPARAAGVWPVL